MYPSYEGDTRSPSPYLPLEEAVTRQKCAQKHVSALAGGWHHDERRGAHLDAVEGQQAVREVSAQLAERRGPPALDSIRRCHGRRLRGLPHCHRGDAQDGHLPARDHGHHARHAADRPRRRRPGQGLRGRLAGAGVQQSLPQSGADGHLCGRDADDPGGRGGGEKGGRKVPLRAGSAPQPLRLLLPPPPQRQQDDRPPGRAQGVDV